MFHTCIPLFSHFSPLFARCHIQRVMCHASSHAITHTPQPHLHAPTSTPIPSQSCTLVKNTVLSLPEHLYCHAFESHVTCSHTISLNSTCSWGPHYFIQIQPRNVTAAYMACFMSFPLLFPLYHVWVLFLFLASTTFSPALVLPSCLILVGAVFIFSSFFFVNFTLFLLQSQLCSSYLLCI